VWKHACSLPSNLSINIPWSPIVYDGQVEVPNPCLCANNGCSEIVISATQ
jgi:hypothetical protein